jgi:hypothetical protein
VFDEETLVQGASLSPGGGVADVGAQCWHGLLMPVMDRHPQRLQVVQVGCPAQLDDERVHGETLVVVAHPLSGLQQAPGFSRGSGAHGDSVPFLIRSAMAVTSSSFPTATSMTRS